MHIRFFVPEEYYCRSIIVIPRPYYGSMSSSFSTLEAYPSFSTVNGWRTVCFFHFSHFFSTIFCSFLSSPSIFPKQGDRQINFGFGQSSVLFCPNRTMHPEYNVGTYAGMFYGVTQTEFEVEIVVSPEV